MEESESSGFLTILCHSVVYCVELESLKGGKMRKYVFGWVGSDSEVSLTMMLHIVDIRKC